MKTLEDFKLMSEPMLRGIHLSLTGNEAKKNMTKDQLVKRVFELQQPDPEPAKPDEAPKPAAPQTLDDTPAADDDGVGVEDFLGEDPAASTTPGSSTDADFLSVDDDGGFPDAPVATVFERSEDNANPKDIRKALAHLSVQVEIEDGAVTISRGAKSICTTLKQPLHRIVQVAEVLAR